MNVIIANERLNELSNLDVEIIKSMNGTYTPEEIINTFTNFYYNKMILDITAIKDYLNISNLQKLVMNIDPNKLILFLPNRPEVSSNVYLSKLVTIGIYNFTNNIDGVKYLITHTNTKEDVEGLLNVTTDEVINETSNFSGHNIVIGFKNLTDHAGATTLIYMVKKELEKTYGETVYAVEVSRHDLDYFNVKNTISTNKEGLTSTISKITDATVILVDLNDMKDTAECDEVIYLIEPSSIMLNKLMRTNRNLFTEMANKKIVLNKSMLSLKDVSEFEYEAKTNIFYNIPPINDRKKSEDVVNFITKLGLLGGKQGSGKFLGIFKI